MSNSHLTCFRCGVCCKKYQVYLTFSEVKQLAGSLAITAADFIDEYTDPRCPGTFGYLIRHQDGACVFLEQTNEKVSGCRIHSFRPKACRDWVPGLDRVECRQGLALWGLSVNDSGEITGSDEDLNRFRSFQNSGQ